MAELKVGLSAEKVIHNAVTKMAKEVQEKFGIIIESVEFDWNFTYSVGEPPSISLISTEIRTKSRC